MARRTIIFAQLGAFSFTNDALSAQLSRNLGDFNIETVRLFDTVRGNIPLIAVNILAEIFQYGPSVIGNRAKAIGLFVKTPNLFRTLSGAFQARFADRGDIAAVFQTQGLFNAHLRGAPLICYIDNTLQNKACRPPGAGIPRTPKAIIELERQLYEQADAIAVSASHVGQSLLEDYGCDPKKIVTVYIGANAPFAGPPASDDRYARQRILFVGIDWERKGGPDLIAAFKTIAQRYPSAELTIVGADPAVSHPRIKVLGRRPPAEVASLIAESSIFCLPSLVEPSSVALIEACRGGLPVVATRLGGFLDSVDDQQTGLLVPPHDPPSLVSALSRLLDRPDLCAAMGKAGAAKVAALFDWDVVGPKIATVIRGQIGPA